MKKFLVLIIFSMSWFAHADHLDVIQVKLNESCDLSQYVAIAKDFNEKWAKAYAYHAEVLSPLQSDELGTVFWVGRTANAAAFGKTWDAWRDGLSDPKSMPAKLWARFQACGTNLSRRGYDTF